MKSKADSDALSITKKPQKSIKAATNYALTINYDTDYSKIDSQLLSANYSANSDYDFYPITVSETGKLYVFLYPDDANTADVEVALGTSSSILSSTALPSNKYSLGFGCIDVTKGSTYYIGFKSTAVGKIYISPYVIPYSTRTLPEGKAMLASGIKGNARSVTSYKIVPAKSGYIDVALQANGVTTTTANVTLLDKNKNVVSATLPFQMKSKTKYVVFGVKERQTYYIRVNNCNVVSSGQYWFAIQYKVTAGKIRSNTKKSKSVKLKRKGKYIKTTLPANGKNSANWYKFKVTKKRATQIRVDATNVKSGNLKITLYCGKKKVASTSVVKGKVNTFKVTYSTTYGKAKKGTYYIKINKARKTNGQYRIKYLK